MRHGRLVRARHGREIRGGPALRGRRSPHPCRGEGRSSPVVPSPPARAAPHGRGPRASRMLPPRRAAGRRRGRDPASRPRHRCVRRERRRSRGRKALLQHRGERGRGRAPLGGLRREVPGDQCLECFRHVRAGSPHEWDGPKRAPDDDRLGGWAGVRSLAGEHLVEHACERVEVAAGVAASAARLLRATCTSGFRPRSQPESARSRRVGRLWRCRSR